MKIEFAILSDGQALEQWQQRCIEQLLSLPGVRAPLSLTRDALSSDRLAYIRRLDLDFVLSFLTEPCPAGLLSAAKHGIWAFCFGDWVRYRGSPAAFWEVYDGDSLTSAMLVRLQADVDEVVVLREGHCRTQALSPARNLDQLLTRITRWPSQVCIDLDNGITGPLTSAPLRSSAPWRSAPTPAQTLLFRCRNALRVVGVVLRSLCRHDQWNVGWIERPIASFLTDNRPTPVRWIPAPRSMEFFADPFGVQQEGRLTILYEDFSYLNNRGTIAAIEPSGAGVAMPVRIGPEPAVHLSYPYLIEVDGRLLCVPESHEAAEIGIYEIERFPDRWVKISTLLPGIPIVDATLFHHEGRWWLAGSEPTATGTTCELHLWYADALTGPWQAHAANPVKMDARSARPGGTPFLRDGRLYRPAQDCSATYGGRIIINRVDRLSPTEFAETVATVVEPDPRGPYPAGLHTLSSVGDVTLIDSKRVMFSPAEFRRVFAHFVAAALKRRPG